MMKKTIIFAYLTLILIFAFLKNAPIAQVEATRTWTVDDDGPADFTKIQEAVDAASPYDTIHVATGTYYEHLSIAKQNLTIVGENPSNTIIDGNGTGSVIFLTADNVTITGFTVRNGIYGINMNQASNCTISDNIITSNEEDGLLVWWGSSNNTISNNVIDLNGAHGIRSEQSCSRNTITDNLLVGNGRGIRLSNCRYYVLRNNNMSGNFYNFGVLGSSPIDFIHDIDLSNTVDEKTIYYLINQSDLVIDPSTFPNLGYLALVNSDNVTVRNLNLANNYQGVLFANTTSSSIEHVTVSHNLYGIYFVFSNYNFVSGNLVRTSAEGVAGIYLVNSKYNTLASNDFDSCYQGIRLISYSSNNTIVKNMVSNNEYGILVNVYSSDNIIYHNNFINNTQQATIGAYSHNTWDNGYPSGGNFWSDYTGEDLYSGPDQNETGPDGIGDTPYVIDGNQDNYPLMSPYVVADLNHDGTVDMYDLAIVGKAYGSKPGDSNWNTDCDLNKDGVVDSLDLEIVVEDYGKTA